MALVALLAGCEPKVTSTPGEKEISKPINYKAVGRAVEEMLPRIRQHVAAITSFGPRQTGQEGCDKTLEYIRSVLASAAPRAKVEEFVVPVTVAQDRTQVQQLDGAGDEFTHIEVQAPGQAVAALPAYALAPNSVQACTTHPPGRCSGTGVWPVPSTAPNTGQTASRSVPSGVLAKCPNCEQFRRLVDLKDGDWKNIKEPLDGAVVLLDFNSGDAWLRAVELGAVGAIFVEPAATTVYQADAKYLATVPLHAPRLYVRAEDGRKLRHTLAEKPDTQVCLKNRLRFANVPARSIELTIPGRSHDYAFVLAGHFDARCIAPDLAYGAEETWGIAELLEVTRYLAQLPTGSTGGTPVSGSAEGTGETPVPPLPCDIRITFVSGHWQSMQPMRDRLTPDGPLWPLIGKYIRLAMALDLVPQNRSLNLITESAWDYQSSGYGWLGKRLFAVDGWRDQIFAAFNLRPPADQKDKKFEPEFPAELFGGVRPTTAEALDEQMAGRNDRSPLVYAPRYPTAEEPWQALRVATFAFQTGRLTRLAHNTPLDRYLEPPPASGDELLRPQLQMALSVLNHIFAYPPTMLPASRPDKRRRGSWGGYARISGDILQWDRSTGWFANRLPGQEAAQPSTQESAGTTQNVQANRLSRVAGVSPASSEGILPSQLSHTSAAGTAAGRAGETPATRSVQTLVQAYPSDITFLRPLGTRLHNYLMWPLAPMRGQHRELQSFMFQDLRLLDASAFTINTIYGAFPETQYDVVGYGVDAGGNVRYATDYGVHGDGNKAFQCTDLYVDNWDLHMPVSLFECGSVELFGLTDPQRYNPGTEVFGSWFQTYAPGGDRADRGVPPHLKITGVKDTDTHTDLERWGYTQYGPTAIVYLPSTASTPGTDAAIAQASRLCSSTSPATGGTPVLPNTSQPSVPPAYQPGAEIILGTWFTNFAVLSNSAAVAQASRLCSSTSPATGGTPVLRNTGQTPVLPQPPGYRVAPGQAIRLAGNSPTQVSCLEQLTALNQRRVSEFARYDVASPLANRFHADSVRAGKQAQDQRAAGDWRAALANFMRAWMFESQAYRNTVALLLDVVSTTVLYFVLLIPFSFLIERLILPQRTVARTAMVSVAVFVLFAAVLYLFHPGFKLAHNVIVTTTAFVIVVMTLPALILLLVRGVAMLRAIGSKAVITQRSEAESAGVVMAALSLAVSNMRRRRLRTALTLTTITTLVVALVLLTTSSAFDFRILEPSGVGQTSLEGVQVYNAIDRRQPLLTETAGLYEAALTDEALVVPRECVNYGYDHKSENGSLYLAANGRRVRLPYFQLMDQRDDELAYALDWTEHLKGSDYARSEPADEPRRNQTVHLSDLLDGQFLAPDDVDVCLIPNTMAEPLGVRVGDTVTMMGLPLRVKGIWAANVPKVQPDGSVKMIPGPLDALKDLDGLPITAMRGSMFRQGEPDNPLHAPSSEQIIVPRKWLASCRIFPSNVYSLVVVPRGTGSVAGVSPASSGTPRGGVPDPPREEGANPTAASQETRRAEDQATGPTPVPPTDPSRGILPLAERLAKEILNVEVFSHYLDTSTGQGVAERISMQTATHVKGSSMMLVILAVAMLMILAIMTGTVYERMREIHIFSSVGLSPRHVAGMFLIEALVYAGIASVLGYFLGIVSLKALLAHLKATGQHQDFYPNYLGVFVLYSIGIAVLSTLASSLYPIRLASKIVNPSEARTWQFEPAADEDTWHIRLPFIATTFNEARAMMVYAFDYLAVHQGERSGRFVCEQPPDGASRGDRLVLEMPVWLAPFERNLTQHALLHAAPTADGQWWELSLDLKRVSGPPYLWRRGASVFLDMLCKHLLRWRAATPQQEADCLGRWEKVYPSAS